MIMFISVPVGGSASSSSNSNANANVGGGGPFFGGKKIPRCLNNFKIQWENRRNKINRCRYHICIFLAWFRSLAKR